MRKALAYIFLALYLNTAMFLPVTGDNAYETSGPVKDHISSGVEYLVQSLLGCRDATPEDEEEDNNSSRYLSQAGALVYIAATPVQLEEQPGYGHNRISYPPGITEKLYCVPLDILSPPPDIA